MPSALPTGDPIPAAGPLADKLTAVCALPAFSAYVHVPFCTTRCGYCDFNTYIADELHGATTSQYVTAVIQEVALARKSLVAESAIPTVFFGGGTPSLLAAQQVAKILAALNDRFGLAPDAEITIEANPESLNSDLLEQLRQAGVNRLSLGMQSAVPHVLTQLDRVHTPGSVATSVAHARAAGFDQVSLDLIYGTPGESLDDWITSLAEATALSPEHISAYALIVEPGTHLAAQVARGEVPAPDDDEQADKYEAADDFLAAAGYRWYEVSNWAIGQEDRCRHNLAYWRGDNWWGFGPGAHSHIKGVRWWNVKHPRAYSDQIALLGHPAAARETLDSATREQERVMLQVRLSEGVRIDSLSSPALAEVDSLLSDGLIEPASVAAGRLALTLRGRLLADLVVRRLTTDPAEVSRGQCRTGFPQDRP